MCSDVDGMYDQLHRTQEDDGSASSRRAFLTAMTMAGGVAMAALPTARAIAAPPADGPDASMTPDAALAEIMAGNARFVAGKPTAHLQDLSIIKARAAEGQWPVVGVLSCADSRVPVEMLFDEYIGRLFVTRIAGNITTPEIVASLEYGVAVLGLKALVVMGHSNCGAVKAAIDNPEVPGQISALFPAILPALYLARSKDAAIVTRTNALVQAATLVNASPVIEEKVKAGTLKVVAAVYDVATGKVDMLPVPADMLMRG
ncbi:carbonic anhydrase [Sphingobium sp. AP49]|uniref:carbonic anhydrase n=1 Tax=Sphingobium sp. AP49 TaxID=1144307 RepID=UPI00026EE323|nr:carbonic anhydrase [Sphingobium sp. AP49]WHO39573.1 carbonic anhydrase [Sphingobium sp. AP49]